MPNNIGVFLCHSSNDKPFVRNLYRTLSSVDGVVPWLDETSLLPGQDWQLEIKKAVRNSDVVVVCLSKSSVNKRGYIQKEITFALDLADEQPEGSIFIIPAFLEPCELPDRLAKYQFVKLYEVGGIGRLLAALEYRANELGFSINVPVAVTVEELLNVLDKTLEEKNWKEADQLTALIMLKEANREKQGALALPDFKNFSCSVLTRINNLWMGASDKRFGFSTQLKIWKDIGGRKDNDLNIHKIFGIQVGWEDVQNNRWLRWGELNFTLSAPIGHLPTPPRWWELWDGFKPGEEYLYYRFDECTGG